MSNLIKLTGSQKQIEWAREIRDNILRRDYTKETISKYLNIPLTQPILNEFIEVYRTIITEEVNDSKVYINLFNYQDIFRDKIFIETIFKIFLNKKVNLKKYDLPGLEGSEKQISFGESKRKELITNIEYLKLVFNEEDFTDMNGDLIFNKSCRIFEEDFMIIRDLWDFNFILKNKSAKFFIENKTTPESLLLDQYFDVKYK